MSTEPYVCTSGVDDVAALEEMIDTAVATGCVDPQRLVVSGESNGAGMALVAICDARLQARFAAAVLVIPAVDAAVLTHCLEAGTSPIGLSVVAGKLEPTVATPTRPARATPPMNGRKAAALVNVCARRLPS